MATARSSTGYHRGELAAQAIAGDIERAAHLGRSIRDTVPAVAARFLAERQLIVVGATDEEGRIWATMLTGPAGFLDTPDERTVTVAARPRVGDPLATVLAEPAQVGTIAIEPATRRRMRVNGRSRPTPTGLSINVEQVVANCPKYIQRRLPEDTAEPGPEPQAPLLGAQLSEGQRRAVAAADTFFLATADDQGRADASHRGGNPGFVEVLSPTCLRWPDYYGNAAYMTLGNLELNPGAGLVFPDWDTGSLLLLSGTARTDWSTRAERSVALTIERVVELPGALPMRWSAPEYSPANPPVPGP
jgi:predicted pyridoxine 5'-phosphate oxidase superfamily flavin-nucleotide-binding protein